MGWGPADRDGMRDPKLRREPFELGFEAAVHGAVLGGAIGDHEDLRAALLENQLRRPRPRLLERGGVLVIEQFAQLSQIARPRRRHHAVRVRPQLSHAQMLARRAGHHNQPEERGTD